MTAHEQPILLSSLRELEPLCEKGHVMLVQNTLDGQLYVKKRVVTHAPELYHRLQREAVPGTPFLYSIFQEEQTPSGASVLTIIEEYLPGRDLGQVLREDGPLPEYQTICIGIELCTILKELHSRRPAIIHRDIKPGNVMLLPDGSVRLLDFSAAKLETPKESRDTVLIGTAGFAAPEQYGFSASNAQTDIYSMGVLLSTLRTGALPWERRAGGQLRRVVDRCLQLHPRDRYPSAEALRRALNTAKLERISWLPPGFRTQRWYKSLIAIAYYTFVYVFFARPYEEPGSPFYLSPGEQLFQGALLLFPVLFYCNYLDIQRFFPFMNSRSRLMRLLGLIIGPIWPIAIIDAVMMVLELFLG